MSIAYIGSSVLRSCSLLLSLFTMSDTPRLWPNRCQWCNRLSRYFGGLNDQSVPQWWPRMTNRWCDLCEQWYDRNDVLFKLTCLCSSTGMPSVFRPRTHTWKNIVTILCGSDHDIYLRVQHDIWRRCLKGRLSVYSDSDWDSSEDASEHDDYFGRFPAEPFLLALWGVDISWTRPSVVDLTAILRRPYSYRRSNGRLFYPEENTVGPYRVLDIIIAFIGFFHESDRYLCRW